VSTRLRDALLWTSVVVGLVGAVAALTTSDIPGSGNEWYLGIVTIGYGVLGWLVANRRPALPIGWSLLAGGAIHGLSFFAAWWAGHGLATDPGSLRLVSVAASSSLWLSSLPWPLVLVAPLVLFPDGRARTHRWRRFLVAVSVVVGVLAIATAIASVPIAIDRPIELLDLPDQPQTGLTAWVVGLASAARLVGFGAAIVALGGVLVAARHSIGLERRQHRTMLVGAIVAVVTPIVGALVWASTSTDPLGTPEGFNSFTLLAIPAAMTLAVVRYRLFDLGILVSRSVLVLLVGGLLAGVYAVVLAVVTAVLDDSTAISVSTVLAAGAVVIATAPAVAWATRTTRRWFGRSADSTSVAARFSAGSDPDGDARSVLERLAIVVRDELRLGSIEIAVDGLESVVAGRPDGPTYAHSLEYQGRRIGQMAATARPGERLAEPDHRALARIAHYVAATAESVKVSDDLRTAQNALQNAYAEERRRVRLDLHDGLGPTLAVIRLKLIALRRRLPSDVSVDDVVDQVSDCIREVRRIVEGLQPSMLEDLGLVPALQVLVADTRRTSGIDITIDAEPEFPDVPAHIAATGYRVIAEGLANVIRHSRATMCTVQLTHPDHSLCIDIQDNGCGFDPAAVTGMGLRSIAARVVAVGGQSSLTSAAGRGTTIRLELPT
jgi:signal transduction histidine kinase